MNRGLFLQLDRLQRVPLKEVVSEARPTLSNPGLARSLHQPLSRGMTLLATAGCCLLGCPVCGQGELWELAPGIRQRGQPPKTWTLDLRGTSRQQASSSAAQLSARLYGPAEPELHTPLVVLTDFATPKVFGFFLETVSRGGSDLVLQTNGQTAWRGQWPAADSTHQVGQLVTVPLPPGTNTIRLEVTQPSGVVVIGRYYLADAPEELPSASAGRSVDTPLPTPPAAQEETARRFKAAPVTGGQLRTEDGYRGIWYSNQPVNSEYRFKYSGGFATYPQQHAPIAIYCPEVQKTFFVYGGTTARRASDPQELLHMISYYDHRTGLVPRPRILLNKQTGDAHDNPTLQVDEQGHLWVFSPSHGTARPSYIHRSARPYDIAEFERVSAGNFSYPQPWCVPGQGFLFLHTRYGGGRAQGVNATRCLFWMTSRDGRRWSEPRLLAGIEQGDYQISWRIGKRVATAFDYHPAAGGLNARANIYYLQTDDMGRTWCTVQGEPVRLPLTQPHNPALVYDSRAEGSLVYLKDLNFDVKGRPVILFLTSKGYEPGPANGPRQWQLLHWSGKQWMRRTLTHSGNNYDHGSLYIEPDGTWRIIAPTDPGPQPYNPGGEMVLWRSADEGRTWERLKALTRNSPRNHTYARRPFNAHPDFYALWADGHGRQPSESHLYFTNQRGEHVWRLPAKMNGDSANPQIAW